MKLKQYLQKNHILFPLIGLVAIIIGFSAISLLNKNDSPNGTTCRGICVSIRENGIDPSELAVKAGEFVQFSSADGKSHNLTTGGDSEDHGDIHSGGTKISSGEFAADEAWRVQFKQPGTYRLRDTKNSNHEILVVVYKADN